MDIAFYFKLFWRRLPVFLLFLTLGSAVGYTIATILPPVYVGRAILIMTPEQIPSDLAPTTVSNEVNETLVRLRQEVLTRENLLELANDFDIYEVRSGQARPSMSADEVVSDLRRRIGIQVSGISNRRGNDNGAPIVTVSFEAPDRALAARIANEIVDRLQEENLSFRQRIAGGTVAFFADEVARLDRELANREAQLLAFQEENLDALPDSLDFRRSQQAAAQERLQQLDRTEATLRDRRNRLVTLYETTGAVLSAPEADRPLSDSARQLASLRQELSQARAVLSESNPRLQVLEARVKTMEDFVASERGVAGDSDAQATDLQLSAYEFQLADIDGQLDFIVEQKGLIQQQMAELQASIEATPRNAVQMQTMQRDYDALRQRYEQAVASRAQAERGELIEANSKGQSIFVSERATPPDEPESPNRTLIAAGGVALGSGLGLAAVVLLELMNSAIRRPADLTASLGIVPFGTIPLIRTPRQIFWRRAVMLVSFLTVALAVPAGLWLLDTYYLPLDLILDKIVDALGLPPGLG